MSALDRSAEELSALVRSGDWEAVLETTSIDGEAVNLGEALDSTDPDRADATLQRILGDDSVEGADLDETLDEILSQDRFGGERETLLDRIRRAIDEWMARFLGGLFTFIPPLPAAILAALLLGAMVTAVAMRTSRRRAIVIERERTLSDLIRDGDDPAVLEGRAEEASASGDHSSAVRLRFLAGILRLHLAGRIGLDAGTTVGEVTETLDSPVFTPVAVTFEEVVYGDRVATVDDDLHSRDGWRQLLGAGVR